MGSPISENPRSADLHLAVMACKRVDINWYIISTKTKFPDPAATQATFDTTPRPSPGLGQLDQLPADILVEICKHLGVNTICAMRGVNSYAKTIVGLVPAFKTTRKYAPHAFQAILKTGAASTFSVQDLFNALVTPGCHICGDFAAHLYLPTLSRCCSNCMQNSPDLVVIRTYVARDLYALTDKQMHSMVGTVKTIPGVYDDTAKVLKVPVALVCRKLAESAGILFHGGAAEMEKAVERRAAATKKLGLHRTWKDSLVTRRMVTVPFPLLDLKSGKREEGVYCRGCLRDWRYEPSAHGNLLPHVVDLNRDRAYDDVGFDSHVRECKSAKKLWHASKSDRSWWLDDKEEGLNWWEERALEAKVREASRLYGTYGPDDPLMIIPWYFRGRICSRESERNHGGHWYEVRSLDLDLIYFPPNIYFPMLRVTDYELPNDDCEFVATWLG